MMKISDLQTTLKKELGDTYVTSASDITNFERLPTGIYPLDFATGGGFPRGKVSILWGPESSGKTNLAMKALAMNQILEPDKVNLILDMEGTFNTKWAKMLGVDCSDSLLAVNQPHYAEQAVNIMHKALEAEDIGCIILDSIGSMVTINEEESDASKMAVGGAALLITKMMKKITVGMSKASTHGSFPTIIIINQMRAKIGVMFGSPDDMPGGKALRHGSSLTVRLYGKDIIDANINPDRPCYKFITGTIVKDKVPIIKKKFEFNFPVINQGGLKVGHIDDWNTISSKLKDLGWMYKDSKVVNCFGEEYPTFKAVREELYSKPDVIAAVRTKILEAYEEQVYGLDET